MSCQSPKSRWFPNAADNNVSFYSGHTAMSFALATASGTVASLRGYRLAPVIWVVGIPLATLTGVLRINADRHYFTDVLTGAVLGSAMGFLGPWLHRKQKSPTAISLYPVITTSTLRVGPQSSTGVMVGLLWSGTLQ
jgi:membrane-associated phospholipid phosphatase